MKFLTVDGRDNLLQRIVYRVNNSKIFERCPRKKSTETGKIINSWKVLK